MRYWQRVAGALGLAISLLGAGCGSAAATATPRPGPRPTFTPPPTEGRLLFVSNAEGGGLTISELKDGLQSPRALWTGIPGRLDGDKQPLGPAIAVSPDRKRAMLITASFEVIIIDLAAASAWHCPPGVIESRMVCFTDVAPRLRRFRKEGSGQPVHRDLAAGRVSPCIRRPPDLLRHGRAGSSAAASIFQSGLTHPIYAPTARCQRTYSSQERNVE
jgi:hypothetical protein